MILGLYLLLAIIIVVLFLIARSFHRFVSDDRIIEDNANNDYVRSIMFLIFAIIINFGGCICFILASMGGNCTLILIGTLIMGLVVCYMISCTIKYFTSCNKTSVRSEQYCLLKNKEYMVEKFEMFLWEIKNNHFDKAKAEFGISYKEFCNINSQLSIYKNISVEDYFLERINETCFLIKLIINADNNKFNLMTKVVIKDSKEWTVLGDRETAYLMYKNFSMS